MKDGLRRRLRRLERALGPCQACEERDRNAAETEQRIRPPWRNAPHTSAPQPETPEELRAEATKLRAEAVALRAKADRREASDWQRDMEDCAEQDAADSRVLFADGCLRCRAESDKSPASRCATWSPRLWMGSDARSTTRPT